MDAKFEEKAGGKVGTKMGVNWDTKKVDAILNAKKYVNMNAKWDAKRDETWVQKWTKKWIQKSLK